MDVLKIIAVLVLSISVYTAIGFFVNKIFHTAFQGAGLLLAGFFAYFSLFQIVYLPLVFTGQRVSLLTKVWGAVLAIILAEAVFLLWKNRRSPKRFHITGSKGILLLTGAVLLFQLYAMLTSKYNGFDTLFYIGQMNTAIQTDAMYLYEGTQGLQNQIIPLRYAISGFYMNGVVWSSLLKLHPILYSRYVVSFTCWLLSTLIVYKIAACTIGKADENRRWMFVTAVSFINIFWITSDYTSAKFLITRSLEAKAYCAGVIIPAFFLAALWLREDWKDRTAWLFLFLAAFAANGISFSSILIVPIMICVICFAGAVVEKERTIVRNGLVCLIAPALYIAAYLIYIKNPMMFLW